jgi:hypothetical protein
MDSDYWIVFRVNIISIENLQLNAHKTKVANPD